MNGFGVEKRANPSGDILIVSCSARKRRLPPGVTCPARRLYQGALLRASLKLAVKRGYTPLILSARFGLVSPEERLPYYDQKLTEAYPGPWPEGRGFYVGSPLYFGLAPPRFRPLLPNGLSIGRQVSYLNKLLRERGL